MITLSFNDSLERERMSAYNSYQTVLGTLQLVNSANQQIDYDDIADTLKQLSGQNTAYWTALRLYTDDESVYEDGAFDFSSVSQEPLLDHCVIQYLSFDKDMHFLMVSGTLKAEKDILYLDMVCDISSIIESHQTQQKVYQIVFLVLSVLCALISYTISRILTKPLSELSKVSQAISAGELSRRAEIKSNDEIGMLANDFNVMAENLENKINQQERFIGNFAHESKTPMTSIIGYADLIRGGTLDEEEQREAANYIVSEGKRLENLSQKLLELLVLKKGNITFTSVQPDLLIRGLIAHLSPIYKKKNIVITCECEKGKCLMEPDLVKSLLVNLIDNAKKAIDSNEGYIHIKSVMLQDGCRISVQDNGRGIPPDSLKHLTEAFYRVDKDRKSVV